MVAEEGREGREREEGRVREGEGEGGRERGRLGKEKIIERCARKRKARKQLKVNDGKGDKSRGQQKT